MANPFTRFHLKAAVAVSLIASVYATSRLSNPPRATIGDADRFRFSRHTLAELSGGEVRTIRPVHPTLARIQSWISSVGASVALNDLDGNGLPDDVCYVDTRIDAVIVAPVPGTTQRYPAFALPLERVGFDRSTMAPMGCLPGDFNQDGAMDILVYFWGRAPVVFVKRDRFAMPGIDAYRAQEIIAQPERWYSNAAVMADVDGDGRVDIVVGNYFPDGARVLDAHAGGAEHMQHSMSRAFNGGGKHLLLSCHEPGSSAICFTEATNAFPEEARHGWTLALGATDLDGDLLPEIYIANDFGPDRLLHNRSLPGKPSFVLLEGRRGWTTPKSKVVGHDSFKGMGVDFGDVNGDGIPDIFVSNIAAEYALEESHFAFLSNGPAEGMRHGLAPYVDRSEQLGLSRSGWSWDVRLGDFDNDGSLEVLRAGGFVSGMVNRWPELHELAMGNDQLLANPASWPRLQAGADLGGSDRNVFSVRSASGAYVDIARDLGVDGPFVTRGIATADVDGDGRLDFAIANQWRSSLFFHNDTQTVNAFLGLHLLEACTGSGRGQVQVTAGHERGCGYPAIGTSVRARLDSGRILTAQADGGSGHSGKRSADVLLGLGQLTADAMVSVELHWRDAHGATHLSNLRMHPGWHTVMLDKI